MSGMQAVRKLPRSPERSQARGGCPGFRPRAIAVAIVAEASPIPTWVTRTSDGRSNRSARTPAGRATKSRGRLRDAAIRPTHTGELVNSHISHDPAVIWKNVPIFENSDAVQRALNRPARSEAKAVTSGAPPLKEDTFTSGIPSGVGTLHSGLNFCAIRAQTICRVGTSRGYTVGASVRSPTGFWRYLKGEG